MTIINMTGIHFARTGLEPHLSARSPEDWFRMACEIAIRFGARIRPESHGGVRCDFREDSPSLVIWSNGYWYDHRDQKRGGTVDLVQHLQESRGLIPTEQGELTDEEWQVLSAQRGGARSRSSLTPARAEWQWAQLMHGKDSTRDLGIFQKKTTANKVLQPTVAWPAPDDPHGAFVSSPPDPRCVGKEQLETTREYFRLRKLSTQWFQPGIIGTRPLQDTEQEREQQDKGADFLFANPYWPFAHFFPLGLRTHTTLDTDRISGMQRTFLSHPQDDYHPAKKTGRAMSGPAGMTQITVPLDPQGCRVETIAKLTSTGERRVFYAEGLETGLSVTQQSGGLLNVLWSTAGYKNLTETILDLDGKVMDQVASEEIHILLVDRDPSQAGEKAAAYLAHTLRRIGRQVLYLLPPPPDGDPDWCGDWNDVLIEGRMDAALQAAIRDADENLQKAPLYWPEDDPASDGPIRPIPVQSRDVLQDTHAARCQIDMREYHRKHTPDDDLQGVHVNVDTTGLGKTRLLSHLPAPENRQDHLLIATPQRRDATRIIQDHRTRDDSYYQRNSRTNVIADEDTIKNMIADRLDASTAPIVWTRDAHYVAHADTLQKDMAENTLPSCYRTVLEGGVQMDLAGALSQQNGELHPDILTHQKHGCNKECAVCPHGRVAQILVRAEQKPDEADEILSELDNPVKNLGPYRCAGTENKVQKATLSQFLPCPMQLNRLLSYQEKAVCTTTALAQHDKRLFAQATEIRQDEMPLLMDSQELNWKIFQEAKAATDYWIKDLQFRLSQTPSDTPENIKIRKSLTQSIASMQKVILFYRFLFDHFLNVMDDDKRMTPEQFTAFINTKKVYRRFVKPFLKSIKAQKIQHEALFEQPYYPSPESHRKIVPTVFVKHLAEALQHGSVFFLEGFSIADRKILLYFPTEIGEELKLSFAGECKKRIEIYTATPDLVLVEMSKKVNENFAEDNVHLVWRPINHTKTAFRTKPINALKSAQNVLKDYWDQGLKVAMLVAKDMAPAMQEWAKKYRPGYEHLIGWIGKHHVAHNDWADCDGLVIWSLDLPPIQVLVRDYLATRRIFGRENWSDLDEFENHWESSRMAHVPLPYLGQEVLSRVYANPDFYRFVRWRVSQIVTQASGRLRGVNNPAGSARQKFCDVYSEIPPIDGLFGTYIDDVILTSFLTPEKLHQQAVERLANLISRYHISLHEFGVDDAEDAKQQAELLEASPKRTVRMSIRTLQKTAKDNGLPGFQSENLREALELLKQSRPDVLDYKIQTGKPTEIIVRDQPFLAPDRPDDGQKKDVVFDLLRDLIQQRKDNGGGEIRFSARDLYQTLNPGLSKADQFQREVTNGEYQLIDIPALYARLQQAFPELVIEERIADDRPDPWTYIRYNPDSSKVPSAGDLPSAGVPSAGDLLSAGLPSAGPGQGEQLSTGPASSGEAHCIDSAEDSGVGRGYNNNTPGQQSAAVPDPDSPTRTMRNPDVITLDIMGSYVRGFVGVMDAPGSLPGDPDPARVFPAFVPRDYLQRLLQLEGQWHRAGGGEITTEILQAFEHRIGLDYRKGWVHWFTKSLIQQQSWPNARAGFHPYPDHPVIETLAVLTHHVDSYLTLQHPECLSVIPALDDAETSLAERLAEDPLLQALLDDWRDHPRIPRLDLRKPLHITSTEFRGHHAKNSG
ncbi:toprim domain-containing protein [Acidithiobacillus sp. M4-SHS-6]|uniref:toprim domain-containing protein n=1 Tax=Acidithiobacillus sp. M4-SHS-6 TaxID=3383024 RepID=UPI0039BE104E